MNEDRAKGAMKDVAGRVERQVGEWTGDTDTQVKGAAKQAEGKVQNAWGKAKDAVKKSDEAPAKDRNDETTVEEEESIERRRAS